MLSGTFERPPRRRASEINIVPILDLLTTIIFFLLLSVSFVEYNKVTVPPASVSAATDVKVPPLQPKMTLVAKSDGSLRLGLKWRGATPGIAESIIPATADPHEQIAGLSTAAKNLAIAFKQKFPEAKTLQLGLGRVVSYQSLITIMDAVRDSLGDIVLYSYRDVEAETGQDSGARR